MKSNFILSSIVAIAALFSLNTFGYKELLLKEPIDTSHNEVGVGPDDVCHIIYNPMHMGTHHAMIVCECPGKEPKVFKNVHKVVSSATGTPGWLEFKNYIGTRVMDKGKSSTGVGGIKRAILCDGPCEKKKNMKCIT